MSESVKKIAGKKKKTSEESSDAKIVSPIGREGRGGGEGGGGREGGGGKEKEKGKGVEGVTRKSLGVSEVADGPPKMERASPMRIGALNIESKMKEAAEGGGGDDFG